MSFLLKTDKTLSKNYQPGVDGLRAVAVILVLIFHVGFSGVPGGFVGVDVFFVISGYLITGIIFNQTEKGTFGNDSNLLIVFYVQIMPDDFVMQLHRF